MGRYFNSYFDYNSKHKVYNILGFKIKIKNKETKLFTYIDTVYTLLNNYVDITKIPPTKGKLRKLQLECNSLLQSFIKLCNKHNLSYWLDGGTLLGAYRHKGFIPWDDDIDLCMLRTEYKKMIPIAKEYFKNSDFIVRERAERCNNFQLRIINKYNENIAIDIFPVDFYYKKIETIDEKIEVCKKIKKAKKIFDKKYNQKYMNYKTVKSAQEDIIKIQNKIILNSYSINESKPTLFFGIDFLYNPKKYLVMDYDLIFPLTKILFEGNEYLAPNMICKYLENLYGDYMSFPKEAKYIRNGKIDF